MINKENKTFEMGRLLNNENLINRVKMVNKNTLLIILVLFLIPIVAAESSYIFKQNQRASLKISCIDINKSLCNSATNCYLTVHYPGNALTDLVKNVSLTYNYDYYNYTLPVLNTTGDYTAKVWCDGTQDGFSTFAFQVTPTGTVQTSILDNPVLLIFVGLALLMVILGVSFSNSMFGFIGSIMFLLGGVYTMIFGFNNVTDLYTRGVAITLIGMGFIFMFISAYEWLRGE
jgi:hypothetical protein